MDNTSRSQNPHLESFETGNPESKGSKKKVRRVSPRKELAVVTISAVAAITGVGGFLSASPPSEAVTSAGYETAASTTPEPSQIENKAPEHNESTPPEETPGTGQERARQESAPAPSWSPSPPRGPAAAESRGS